MLWLEGTSLSWECICSMLTMTYGRNGNCLCQVCQQGKQWEREVSFYSTVLQCLFNAVIAISRRQVSSCHNYTPLSNDFSRPARSQPGSLAWQTNWILRVKWPLPTSLPFLVWLRFPQIIICHLFNMYNLLGALLCKRNSGLSLQNSAKEIIFL